MPLPPKFYAPLAVTIVVALIVLFTPASGVPSGFEHSDKIVHFVLFAGLAYTSRLAAIRLPRTVIWTVTFAVVSEIMQAILPIGRSGSALDVVADVAGITVGCALALALLPHRSRNAGTLH